MNRNIKVVKIILLLLIITATVAFAADGNITADQLACFKEIICDKIDTFDKRINNFYAAAGVIISLLGILLALVGVKSYTNEKEFKTMESEAKQSIKTIDNTKKEVEQIQGQVLATKDEIRKDKEESKKILEDTRESARQTAEHEQEACKIKDNMKNASAIDPLPENKESTNTALVAGNNNIKKALDDKNGSANNQDRTAQIVTQIDGLFPFLEISWDWCLNADEKAKVLDSFSNASIIDSLDINTFINLLFRSFSLNKKEKIRVINKFPTLNISQYESLIETFIEENEKFQKLNEEHQEDVNKLIYEALNEWIDVIGDILDLKEEEVEIRKLKYIINSLSKIFKDAIKYISMVIISAVTIYKKDADSAISILKEAIKGASDGKLYMLLAKIYTNQDDYGNATNFINDGLGSEKLESETKIALYALALNIYIRQKRWEEAGTSASELKSLKLNHHALLEYMEALIYIGRFEEANKVFDKNIEFEMEDNNHYRAVYLWLLYILDIVTSTDKGKVENSKTAFEEALQKAGKKWGWDTKEIEEWSKKDKKLSPHQKEEIEKIVEQINTHESL